MTHRRLAPRALAAPLPGLVLPGLVLPWLAVALLGGCDRSAAPPPPPATSPSAVAAPTPSGPPPYAVDVKGWEGPVGEEGYVIVSVEAKEGHKINPEYPQRVQLETGQKGLELPLPRMSLKDAQLESPQRLVFTVPATPTEAGQYQLRGQLKLSVCTEDQCRTATEPLLAQVTAQ